LDIRRQLRALKIECVMVGRASTNIALGRLDGVDASLAVGLRANSKRHGILLAPFAIRLCPRRRRTDDWANADAGKRSIVHRVETSFRRERAKALECRRVFVKVQKMWGRITQKR
jgi:hypothetical protein